MSNKLQEEAESLLMHVIGKTSLLMHMIGIKIIVQNSMPVLSTFMWSRARE